MAGPSFSWTQLSAQSCFLLTRELGGTRSCLRSPWRLSPGVYGSVGCLIICRGCSSPGLQPWEKLPGDSPGGCSPTGGPQVCVCVCTRGGEVVGPAHSMSCSYGWALPGAPDSISPLGFPDGRRFDFPRKSGHHLSATSPSETRKLCPSFLPFLAVFPLFEFSSDSPPSLAVDVWKLFLLRRAARTPGLPAPVWPLTGLVQVIAPLGLSSPTCSRPLFPPAALTALCLQRDPVLGREKAALLSAGGALAARGVVCGTG